MEQKKRQFKKDAVYRLLHEQLIAGKFACGEKLPPELELGRCLGVARVTLRSALAKLEADGLVERRHPGGTIVLDVRRRLQLRVLVVVKDNLTHWATAFYLLPGIEFRCRELNLEIQFATAGQLPEKISQPENYLGAILLETHYTGEERELALLRSYPFPTVQLFGFVNDSTTTGFAAVRSNFRVAFFDGLRHLLHSGHRRIAILTLPWDAAAVRNDVTETELKQFFRECDIPESGKLIRELTSPDETRSAVRELMKLSSPPTAIYCYSDKFAIEVYAELRQLNIPIPKQVAVMNSFGAQRAVLLQPELSFVDTHQRLAAITAVDLLFNRRKWENVDPKPCLLIPHCVVANESTNVYHHPLLNKKAKK